MLDALKTVVAPAVAASILMLLLLCFSALGRRFTGAMRVCALLQLVAFLVAIGIASDRAYRGVNFNVPAVVAIYLFCTLSLTAAAMPRPWWNWRKQRSEDKSEEERRAKGKKP